MKTCDFLNTIETTKKYVSRDTSRAALCGVYIEYTAHSQTIEITATNGHILYHETIKEEQNGDKDFSFIFDGVQYVKDNKKELKNSGFPVHFDNLRTVYGIDAGPYPNYRVSIPAEDRHPFTIIIDKPGIFGAFIDPLKGLTAATSKATKLLRMHIDHEKEQIHFKTVSTAHNYPGTIHAHTTPVDVLTETAPHFDGPSELERVGFNGDLLYTVARTIWDFNTYNPHTNKKNKTFENIAIRWGFTSKIGASVMRCRRSNTREILALIMPLRIFD